MLSWNVSVTPARLELYILRICSALYPQTLLLDTKV